MTALVRHPLVVVWALLSLMTVASWWTGTRGDGGALVAITVSVLLLAAIKARLVMRWFMEVRAAPRWLRLACDAWLVGMFAMVVGMYFGVG